MSHTATRLHDQNDEHDDFGGLHRDLPHLVGRRRALLVLGGAGLAGVVAACSSGSSTSSTPSTSTSTPTYAPTSTPTTPPGSTSPATGSAAATTAAATGDGEAVSAGAEIPDETAGPYPSDGSNGPSILVEDGVVRSDLTASIGSLSGTAVGIPLTVQLTVVDAATGAGLAGAALYLWQCTAEGRYSMYEITDQNYLRGVQVADDSGRMTFTTIFPGCYQGRWPHFHFEVYDDVSVATSGSSATKTSQIALPQADCEVVYADERYGNSSRNLSQLSLATDHIFADGWQDQLATVSGSNDAGYTASLLARV